MVAILTGDIVHSQEDRASEWMSVLKQYLDQNGRAPQDWEIYRGDEFQVRTSPERALFMAIQIKALIRSIKPLDVRMAIGIGPETFVGEKISESNGEAYQRSGRLFETLKGQKLNMALASGEADRDRTLNLIMVLALEFMDRWSPVLAEMVSYGLAHPGESQQWMADRLGINQSAVSQRLDRARMDLVQEVLAYYNVWIKDITV